MKYRKKGKEWSADNLKKIYPLESLENEFEKIEKLGFEVFPSEYQCLIYKSPSSVITNLIIDADFYDDYHTNAASAIDSFWNINKPIVD